MRPPGVLVCEGASAPSSALDARQIAPGWWSAHNEETGALVPLFRVDGRRIVPRYTGNVGDTPEEAWDFISCGARAGFSIGIRLEP